MADPHVLGEVVELQQEQWFRSKADVNHFWDPPVLTKLGTSGSPERCARAVSPYPCH